MGRMYNQVATLAEVETLCQLWGYELVEYHDGLRDYMYSSPVFIAQQAQPARAGRDASQISVPFKHSLFDEYYSTETIIQVLQSWSK